MSVKTGYIHTYHPNKGYGFCYVKGMDKRFEYTSIFFHISEVAGLKSVTEKHKLTGKVSKGPKGWQMTDITAKYDKNLKTPVPKRRRTKRRKKKRRPSQQPKRLPPSLRAKDKKRLKEKSEKAYREMDGNKKENDRKGGRWKGDKYIPR